MAVTVNNFCMWSSNWTLVWEARDAEWQSDQPRLAGGQWVKFHAFFAIDI